MNINSPNFLYEFFLTNGFGDRIARDKTSSFEFKRNLAVFSLSLITGIIIINSSSQNMAFGIGIFGTFFITVFYEEYTRHYIKKAMKEVIGSDKDVAVVVYDKNSECETSLCSEYINKDKNFISSGIIVHTLSQE